MLRIREEIEFEKLSLITRTQNVLFMEIQVIAFAAGEKILKTLAGHEES